MKRLAYFLGLFLAALAISIFVIEKELEKNFYQKQFLSGIVLLLSVVVLMAFRARKKMRILPLGRVAYWYIFHICIGLFACVIFAMHVRTLWPEGFYEKCLALFFYAVSFSGIVGLVLQKIIPKRLVDTQHEFLYERIPQEIASIRKDVENLVLLSVEKTRSETLARMYQEILAWYFYRPRFVWATRLGNHRSQAWISLKFRTWERYLDSQEKQYLQEIYKLAEYKQAVDVHYALQGLLRKWLYLHIPLALVCLILVMWHVVLVGVYVR